MTEPTIPNAITVSSPITEGDYTWADVHDDGEYAGRIVHVMPSDTWRPNDVLQNSIGEQSWDSYDSAKTDLEGGANEQR